MIAGGMATSRDPGRRNDPNRAVSAVHQPSMDRLTGDSGIGGISKCAQEMMGSNCCCTFPPWWGQRSTVRCLVRAAFKIGTGRARETIWYGRTGRQSSSKKVHKRTATSGSEPHITRHRLDFFMANVTSS
eukprot:scaffold285_cov330-Pavlova_lutheri.AAC.146